MSIKIRSNAKIDINSDSNGKVNFSSKEAQFFCTIQPTTVDPDPYAFGPYFTMQREWIDGIFPYTFTIEILEINGITYTTGQTITIYDINDLQIGVGTDGRVYYTDVVDWINGVIPSGIPLIFYDDMNSVQYAPGIQYRLVIKDENAEPNEAWYEYSNIYGNHQFYGNAGSPSYVEIIPGNLYSTSNCILL